MVTDQFISRWDDAELDGDKGYLPLPGFILRHYMKFKDRQGNTGLTSNEFIFFCHVMSFKYDCHNGQSSPSLQTIADRMGINKRSVSRIASSLKNKGAMTITERPGQTSIYGFGELVKQCRKAEQEGRTQESGVTVESSPPTTLESSPPTTLESSEDIEDNSKKTKKEVSASDDAQSATQMQNPEPSQPTQPQSVKEPGDTEIKAESGILTDHSSPPETIFPPSPQDEDDVEKQRSKDISAIIKIHLDTGVIDSKPGQSYKNKTKRTQAEAILDAGISVEQVSAYVNYLKNDEFWQDRSISMGYIVNNIKAWVNSTEAEPENPAHKIWEPDDVEPFYWVDDPEQRAAMLQNAKRAQQALVNLMSMDMGVPV